MAENHGIDIVISERTGAIGPHETRISDRTGANVRSAPLWSLAAIRDNARGANIVMIGAVEPFDAAALESLPKCVAVVRRGAGYDNIDVDAATRLGILVANVPDASVEEVSDHALALLLSLERRIGPLNSAVRSGGWLQDPAAIQSHRRDARRLRELTLAVIGLGRIGRALAAKARPMYGAVIGVAPSATPEMAAACGVRLVTFEEALGEADHISLHVPLLPSTQHLISASSLARMRPGAILVNTARGGLVDEAALGAALVSGRLAAAGLDVTEHEPLEPGDPLLETSAVLTAHSASWSVTARAEIARRSADEAIRVASGQLPSSIVNPEVVDSLALRFQRATSER